MRTIRTTMAGLMLALVIALTSLAPAPTAEAAVQPNRLIHNAAEFNRQHTGQLEIKLYPRSAKSVRVYVDGKSMKWKPTNQWGFAEFRVGRERMRDHRTTTVMVKGYRAGDVVYVKKINVVDTPRPSKALRAVAAARSQVGDRYLFGADGPNAYDCSGLTKYAYATVGIRIPHSSAAQSRLGRSVSSPKPGDLVYTPGHIAIYAGNGRVIEAATPRTGVIERRMWQRNPEYRRLVG